MARLAESTRFFITWTFLSSLLIPIGAGLGLLAAILIDDAAVNTSAGEEASAFLETANYCIAMTILGAIVSFKQWLLLRKITRISAIWILACVGGLIIGESLSGLVLWKLDISRADLGWPQGGSILAEALIFTFSGILIGIFQYPLLKKAYYKAEIWILASAIAWGLVPLVIYIFGGLALGAITGATLIWILAPKENHLP